MFGKIACENDIQRFIAALPVRRAVLLQKTHFGRQKLGRLWVQIQG
jgi:hypothetical protein